MNLQGYFTCIRWDFGYDSSMPEANEMAVSDFRAFLLHKIQHWVIKRFQKSPSWEIHLTERQRSAGTFQFTQRLNHLQEMNHYNNETAPSVFFLELMKYPPVPPKKSPPYLPWPQRPCGIIWWHIWLPFKDTTCCCCISLRKKEGVCRREKAAVYV